MQLSARQKFSLIFSIYVFLFIALAGTVFFLLLHTLLIYQAQKDTAKAATDVLKNHIALNKDNVAIIKDQTGSLLSNEVIESNISILLLNNNLGVIRGYGLLELYNQSDQKSVQLIAKMAKDTQISLKPSVKIISWRGQNLSIYVAPVKNSGKSYGVIVSAKSLAQVESLEEIVLFILAGLAVGSILVSLLLSRFLVRKMFKPILSLTEIISATDLDKLDKSLTVTGHRSDELVILGNKFNEMMVRLKSMAQQQKEFITNVSHELKTPLTRAISSFDLLLLSNNPNSKVFKNARDDLFEINSLLDKLMFLSKLRPGIILPSDKISLNQFIKDSIELSQTELKNRKVSVTSDLDTDATIVIPKEYAKVLLRNLLSNAIKYSKENSKIIIQTLRTNNKISLTIADQGRGMRKSDLKRIGERFYRGAGGRETSGHGIGLSIVKRIADLYKICLLIKSKAGEGTTVILEFPVY